MYDELTEVDIRKMQEEMDYRIRGCGRSSSRRSRPPGHSETSARTMNINAPSRPKTATIAASAIWSG